MIAAGDASRICHDGDEWVFIDLGFSRDSKTCGLLVGDGSPSRCTFGDLQRELVRRAGSGEGPLNLVLEAPLSVAFTAQGNPVGRSIEKTAEGHRYWYAGVGCQMMVAAGFLLRALLESAPVRPILLFEAFVTFKPKRPLRRHKGRSDERDVIAMRDVAWSPIRQPGEIIGPDALLSPEASRLQSAFTVFGFDLGIPPVIVARPN